MQVIYPLAEQKQHKKQADFEMKTRKVGSERKSKASQCDVIVVIFEVQALSKEPKTSKGIKVNNSEGILHITSHYGHLASCLYMLEFEGMFLRPKYTDK